MLKEYDIMNIHIPIFNSLNIVVFAQFYFLTKSSSEPLPDSIHLLSALAVIISWT